jgi:hypothetical protein
MTNNRYNTKKESMPMYGHIFIGVIMAGFVAACLGYGSLAYLDYKSQEEKKTRLSAEERTAAVFEREQAIRIAQKWVTISNKDKECRINTLTQEKICREK